MLWAHPAAAQQNPRDLLIDLATVEVAHDLCGFDLTDAQDDMLTARRNKLVDDGAVTGDDIASVHDALASAMARQVPEGLCRKGGAGERAYREKLDALAVGQP